MEKLVSHKGHLMGLENVNNPLLAFCVSRSIFSDGSVCTRIERRSADKTRPIKISVTNSNNVHEILLKSKNLRLSQLHKTVKFTLSGLKQYLNTEGIYTNNPNKCVYVCVYTVRDVCL